MTVDLNRKIKTTEINLSRTINACPEDVFEAWLDRTSPGSPWFGVPKAILNPPKIEFM